MGINRAKKSLGQNFLKNENICLSIASYLKLEKNVPVLEIGPGRGALTKYLVKDFEDLTVVELDTNLSNYLTEMFPSINVINQNIMKTDVSKYEGIIGNIPYNITTEILVLLVKKATNCREFVFMIQKEAYERIVVAKKKSERTPLSIILSTFYASKFLMSVTREQFEPKPNVDSVVFKLDRNNINQEIILDHYYRFLLILFSSRRKNIMNNLIRKFEKEKIQCILNEQNIDKNERSEDLSNEQLISLYLSFNK